MTERTLKVLLADDEPIARRGLERALRVEPDVQDINGPGGLLLCGKDPSEYMRLAAEYLNLSGETRKRHAFVKASEQYFSNFAIDFAGALVALAGLAFLGLGAEIGTPEWGTMLADSQLLLFVNPVAPLGPALAIILLTVTVNLIGDWAYDRYAGR